MNTLLTDVSDVPCTAQSMALLGCQLGGACYVKRVHSPRLGWSVVDLSQLTAASNKFNMRHSAPYLMLRTYQMPPAVDSTCIMSRSVYAVPTCCFLRLLEFRGSSINASTCLINLPLLSVAATTLVGFTHNIGVAVG